MTSLSLLGRDLSLLGRDRNKYLETSPAKVVITRKRNSRINNEFEVKRDPSTGELWVVQHANPRLHQPESKEEGLITQLAHSFQNLDL